MMVIKGRGRIRAALCAVLAFSLLATMTTLFVIVGSSSKVAAAPPGSQFDPGFIISDHNFFNYNSMSVAQIQQFLDSKGPATCNGCLRQYTASTYAKPANPDRCVNAIVAKDNVSAAQMIYDVSQACRINPQVLLVTLQKETSLVTMSAPESWRYQRAMGYACPDGAPCSTAYYGLFIQLYSAASQLRYYGKGTFTWYPPGKTVSVRLHPNAACGGTAVYLHNQATADLYYYTPYQPNAAALANLYGTGDSCSSYGNRNFWRLFNDWFGDPTIDSDILTADDGSGTYLTVGDQRWVITDPLLLEAFAPLGPAVTVSIDRIMHYSSAGTLGRVVTDSSGTVYLVDGGTRYAFSGCDQVAAFGYSCTGLPELRADQAAHLPTSTTPLTSLVAAPDGSISLFAAGERREVFDTASLTEAGITVPAMTNLSQAFVDSRTRGVPIVRTGAEIHVRVPAPATSTAVYYSLNPTTVLSVSSGLQTQTDLLASLAGPSGKLDQASIDKLTVSPFPAIFSPSTSDAAFALQAHGRVELATPTNWLATVPELPATVTDKIPVVGTPLIAPTFIGRASDGVAYFVASASRTAVVDHSTLVSLAAMWRIPETVHVLADDAVMAITPSTTLPPPPPAPSPSPTPTSTPTPTPTATPTPTPTPTPSTTPGAPAPTTITYTVVSGDTVSALAVRFGSTIAGIVEANHLNDKALILVGQKLTIPVTGTPAVTPPVVAPAPPPATTYTTYKVKRGDTVWKISRKYHTTVAKIIALNHLNKRALIRVGQTLKIPKS